MKNHFFEFGPDHLEHFHVHLQVANDHRLPVVHLDELTEPILDVKPTLLLLALGDRVHQVAFINL